MQQTLHLALIYGSTRQGRFCDTVAEWAASRVQTHGGYTLDAIDPLALTLFPLRHEQDDEAEVAALARRLDRADAFIIVVPEYNHSFPAALKHVIDSVNREWHGKPVGFVSYGGVSGGLRAVEQLRLVFAELHAMTVRNSVSFANAWELFDERGRLRQPQRHERSMDTMLQQLRWWASALKAARQEAPPLAA